MLNELESADLDIRMNFPDGLDDVAAQLVVECRKSHLIIAKINMTAEDLVNFYARRSVGSLQGESRVLAEPGRAFLNKERALISVYLPSAVEVFGDEGDGRSPDKWAEDAARAYGAHDYRITKNRNGYTVSLIYFSVTASDVAEQRYLQGVKERLQEQAEKYGKQALRRKLDQS